MQRFIEKGGRFIHLTFLCDLLLKKAKSFIDLALFCDQIKITLIRIWTADCQALRFHEDRR